MPSGDMPTGRPFCIFDAKRKIHPAPHSAAERGKCEAPTLNVKTKREVTQGKMTASTFEL